MRTDFHLVNYDVWELHTLTLANKRERLGQLDIAKKAFALESKLLVDGQQTITRFFRPLHTHTLMAEEAAE